MKRLRALFLTLAASLLGLAAANPLTFVLDTISGRQLEAQAIADQLRAVGVNVEVRVWEWAVLQEEVLAGNRAAYTTDWGSAYFDPFDLAEPKLTTGGRGNYSFYENDRVDELLRMASTTADEGARLEAYFEVQDLIFEDAPWIYGYYLDSIEAASSAVGNWQPAMDSRINLHRVTVEGDDTIVVGLRSDSLVTLDPANYRDRETETVIRNMFDGLVTRTHDGEVVPEIAESWEQVDETTFDFTLREGVLFHNGDEMTADDVVFTFWRILEDGAIDGATSPRRGLLGPLESVEKVDDNTVRFNLSDPFPPFLQALVHFQIVPEGYLTEVGDAEFARNPIGTGPFVFVRGELESEIVLDRFDDYYGGAPDIEPVGTAQVERAIFRNMPEPATRVSALLADEIHIAQAVPPDLVTRLEGEEGVEVLTTEGTRAFMIELNNAQPPFDDVRVRQALNYAIDWEGILEGIYLGYGAQLATAFLPSGFGFNPDLAPYPYDPERAAELLQEAGYDAGN